jgi:hypothetical protein
MSNVEQRILNDEVQFSWFVTSAFNIQCSLSCGLPASGGAKGDLGSLLNCFANYTGIKTYASQEGVGRVLSRDSSSALVRS